MGDTPEIGQRLTDLKHNIRNPLYIAKSLIESHLERLDVMTNPSEPTSPRTKTVLKKSLREIERVLKIIRRLNQIAKEGKEANADNGFHHDVGVKEILARVIGALRAGNYLQHLVLIQFIPSNLPFTGARPIDLEEIFFNLISNATQATIDGGRLTIEAKFQPEPVPAVVISFEDTGHGISEEALPHIFEPFYTGRAEKEGVGFGLYIVKQLVERNGGQITVQSKLNAGSTFTLNFPVTPPPTNSKIRCKTPPFNILDRFLYPE